MDDARNRCRDLRRGQCSHPPDRAGVGPAARNCDTWALHVCNQRRHALAHELDRARHGSGLSRGRIRSCAARRVDRLGRQLRSESHSLRVDRGRSAPGRRRPACRSRRRQRARRPPWPESSPRGSRLAAKYSARPGLVGRPRPNHVRRSPQAPSASQVPHRLPPESRVTRARYSGASDRRIASSHASSPSSPDRASPEAGPRRRKREAYAHLDPAGAPVALGRPCKSPPRALTTSSGVDSPHSGCPVRRSATDSWSALGRAAQPWADRGEARDPALRARLRPAPEPVATVHLEK